MADFKRALEEIKPAFGMDNSGLENRVVGGFYNFGASFESLYGKCNDFVNELRSSDNTQLLTILLEGKSRSGKTALAAKLALESNFPFVKMISPENFVGHSEFAKVQQIVKIFEDAYKSSLSLIILDDIERLFEFIHIGPRFSNHILQSLMVLIKKTPPNLNRKLMIVGTTSMKEVMDQMDVINCFNVCLNVPSITQPSEVLTVLNNFKVESPEVAEQIAETIASEFLVEGISIKNLILAIEIGIQKSDR